MDSYKIIIIDNIDQFNKNFNLLYETSLISETSNGIHIIGLDCEYLSRINYPESYNNADWCINKNDSVIVCKLQIATNNLCFIIDLCKFGKLLPDNLICILKSESWIKFGVGISNDIDILSYQYNLGNCNGVFNASILYRFFGFQNPSLENLYNLFSKDPFKKLEIEKRDWSAEMTISQVKYASEDAIASYLIGIELLNSMKNSFSILLKKYENQTDNIMDHNQVIEIPLSDENYVGLVMEYVQKNKLKPPIFNFEFNNNAKTFVCTCIMDVNDSLIECKSEKYGNKKDCKQNVCKKVISQLGI